MESCRSTTNEKPKDERSDVWKNRHPYSPPVRVENWNEDLFMEEEKFKLTKYKRDHCQLLVQKTRAMFKSTLKSVALAKEMPYVLYGENYQIQASELPNKLIPEVGTKAAHGLNLSGLINERDINSGHHFMPGCTLTASPERTPCVRNVFVMVGCDGQSDGQTVYYGDDVYIRICESGTTEHLFIRCENATCDSFGSHLKLQLTDNPDVYCRFKIYHWDPQLRLDTTGTGFTPNARVIIQHTASGRNLAAEYSTWIPTFFGSECVVSCHTFRDTHKMETAENIWKIIGTRSPDMNLYVRAAKGEDIPLDLLN